MDMKFRFILPKGPEYCRERMLRWEALDKSLGRPPNFEVLSEDEKSLHLIALHGKKLVGCICFLPETGTQGKIFEMAVSQEYQGRGFGRQLLLTLERSLIEKGILDVYLHAHIEFESFYQRLGYLGEGDVFVKMGQSLKRMKKSLSSTDH